MSVSGNRRIAIVGVGSAMSKSLATWLATLGWNIALISRSEQNLSKIAQDVIRVQKNSQSKVVYRAADASEPDSLKAALDWSVQELGGKLDVLNYNAARVAASDITTVTPEELEMDFRVSAIGTLVAGQWFQENASVDRVEGEKPLFLVTGGVLDKHPIPPVASLSTAKAASQTVSRLFAQVLPEQAGILVGMPLVSGVITDLETGEFNPDFHPDDIIQNIFRPFFEDRERMTDGLEWTVERVM
ncbi:hypothetical protein ASPWEDRAFT_30494 [Aspergillus wentii DTO 134E9]|uniref:Uncharacterized protein n=1 Tax=Aspergillus wentii DTO 134E9 TaxID=1073089 RepID=A0A1L9REX1_ASPWE|nr:uncharacterized protein ASPWEDRAFT_30494 [Aspergillus wentii DTO 134E9]KAI9933664.1 hypothetical protein MW887_008137 [Aspergillus wentii]OJJ33417.1 hypothetical protein ASPWEDRAFT_30494 [Aspergillus wentii DTO 134E9]